jgi:nicotinate-nucleotide adenylyltransferase
VAGLIGVFGGTFDPPHLGHLILAAEAYDQLGLDRLLWVLTPDPPHKQGQHISQAEVRLQLVHAAICDNPHFELSRIDLDRPGPHYAVDTVRLLSKDFPATEMIYLIGGDSLHDLPTWRLPLELVEEVDAFGVMRRPGDAVDLTHLEQALPGLSEKVRFVDAPLLEISASQIRQRIRTGRPFRYFLPQSVYEIVAGSSLYQD